MSHGTFYTSPEWRTTRQRVLDRDGNRCAAGRLIGGPCSASLHVHHIVPRDERPDLELDEDNLIVVCSSHHPTLEALRRLLRILLGDAPLPPCGHSHPYPSGRRECERRRRSKLVQRKAEQFALARV